MIPFLLEYERCRKPWPSRCPKRAIRIWYGYTSCLMSWSLDGMSRCRLNHCYFHWFHWISQGNLGQRWLWSKVFSAGFGNSEPIQYLQNVAYFLSPWPTAVLMNPFIFPHNCSSIFWNSLSQLERKINTRELTTYLNKTGYFVVVRAIKAKKWVDRITWFS